jgi:hypothetical protein
MSQTLTQIQMLAQNGKIVASAHGYDEMAEDGIFFSEALDELLRRLWKTIPMPPKVRAFWYFKRMTAAAPFMWSGALRKESQNRVY